MPRVLLQFDGYKDWWRVSFLQADCRTVVGRGLRFRDPERIRELLRRANAGEEDFYKFEHELEMRGRGSVWLELTPEQYEKLRGQGTEPPAFALRGG